MTFAQYCRWPFKKYVRSKGRYQGKRTKMYKGRGIHSKNVRPCNFQTIITCKASQIHKTISLKLYTQDRSNHEKPKIDFRFLSK